LSSSKRPCLKRQVYCTPSVKKTGGSSGVETRLILYNFTEIVIKADLDWNVPIHTSLHKIKENLKMTNEQNKAIVRRFWKAFEANDQAALNEVLAPDLVARTPGAPEPLNRAMHLQGIRSFNAAFSDRLFTIDELIAEGDKVATRTTLRGTHTGDLQGHPPTGKQIAATGLTIERIKDGKIAERWFSFDAGRVMQELGRAAPMQGHP
jgi:steroid delta-isomerase-like uncharacterized protein